MVAAGDQFRRPAPQVHPEWGGRRVGTTEVDDQAEVVVTVGFRDVSVLVEVGEDVSGGGVGLSHGVLRGRRTQRLLTVLVNRLGEVGDGRAIAEGVDLGVAGDAEELIDA